MISQYNKEQDMTNSLKIVLFTDNNWTCHAARLTYNRPINHTMWPTLAQLQLTFHPTEDRRLTLPEHTVG